ncbi:MAG: nickel-type superoxide dismutase maturation protease [Leptolyngbyaceae bacterium]|nr:nickel-type superoxide dismutase maturation protease [Leptolyngbyaceae bacterium]
MVRINVMGQFTALENADFDELMSWVRRKRRRFRVSGQSMAPLLREGEEVLIDPFAYLHHSPEPGDIVVAEHPTLPGYRLIKRVVAVLDSGDCILIGDNSTESTDSRSFGAVPRHKIMGRVTSRFSY